MKRPDERCFLSRLLRVKRGSTADVALASLSDTLRRIVENTAARDWIYILAFICAVYLSYVTITGIKVSFGNFWRALANNPPLWFELPWSLLPRPDAPQPSEPVPVLDTTALVQSVIIAYLVMKIDITDIASGVAAVTSKIGALKV